MTIALTEYLPQVRCTVEMKRKLEEITAHSVTPRVTDHIRAAIEDYIEKHWREEYADDATPELVK
ncbi:MAG: hypothetical protein DCC55_15500 [Chloroflexi bacterium]|nr:MAG: hypothetical protein DCC55_15500 [Chloroflexota bacterium]